MLDLLCVANLATWISTKSDSSPNHDNRSTAHSQIDINNILANGLENFSLISMVIPEFSLHELHKRDKLYTITRKIHPCQPFTSYLCYQLLDNSDKFTPIGMLILSLIQKLAWEHPQLRCMVDDLKIIQGTGSGYQMFWHKHTYSTEIRTRIYSETHTFTEQQNASYSENNLWHEWFGVF